MDGEGHGRGGMKLDHRIGLKTAHAYEKETKAALDKTLDEYAAPGRSVAEEVRFTNVHAAL